MVIAACLLGGGGGGIVMLITVYTQKTLFMAIPNEFHSPMITSHTYKTRHPCKHIMLLTIIYNEILRMPFNLQITYMHRLGMDCELVPHIIRSNNFIFIFYIL